MDDIEKAVYNEGERLIPGITHTDGEKKRHAASYSFFWQKIMDDMLLREVSPISILDLGCGVGWGCAVLSTLPGSIVVGIDNSANTIEYAKKHYPGPTYVVADLVGFIPAMPEYPYVVSRGVFEHIADGLGLIPQVKFGRLFMFDVPYDESPDNRHHLLTGLTEKDFAALKGAEFFYEDMDGVITKEPAKKPNMLMCVCRGSE
jgi:SAM-dependent methyltransferase